MQEYNDKLCKNEAEKQAILQIVAEFRKEFPNVNKSTLMSKQ